jgi:hypothetical protein
MVLKNCGASENPKCAELYFSSHNNIARWLGVDLGRTANTLAKSDGPKVNVRAFYRKFKSGSSETIHYRFMHANSCRFIHACQLPQLLLMVMRACVSGYGVRTSIKAVLSKYEGMGQ